MFARMCKYIESTLQDAYKEGLIEKQDFSAKAQAIFCFVMGRLFQARVSNDVEVLRDLSPTVMQMIGAAVPA